MPKQFVLDKPVARSDSTLRLRAGHINFDTGKLLVIYGFEGGPEQRKELPLPDSLEDDVIKALVGSEKLGKGKLEERPDPNATDNS